MILEKVGVSDPEGDRLSGWTFIGAGLHNLVSDMADSMMPDLILHQGSAAIKEYKNPSLMPGMFPTLWPFGIGRFEDLALGPSINPDSLLCPVVHSGRYQFTEDNIVEYMEMVPDDLKGWVTMILFVFILLYLPM